MQLASIIIVHGQEEFVVRHPPYILPHPVEQKGVALVDELDLAYLSYLAYKQVESLVSLRGAYHLSMGSLPGVLEDIHRYMLEGDVGSASYRIEALRARIERLPAGELQALAEYGGATLPSCQLELTGERSAVGLVYLLPNPYAPLQLQDCAIPDTVLEVASVLDLLLMVASFNETRTIETLFLLPLYHIPSEAATPELVSSILEGELNVSTMLRDKGVDEEYIMTLYSLIANGTEKEALAALRTLRDMARTGLISWDQYAEALKLYRERFGAPQLEEEPGEEDKEVPLSIEDIARNLQGIVEEAEKARAQASNKTNREGASRGLAITIQQPSPIVVVLAFAALAPLVVYRERDRLEPVSRLARVLIGVPPSNAGADWCYRVLVTVLGIKGLRKYEHETPREYLERVRGELPEDVLLLLESVTEDFERAVYAEQSAPIDTRECVVGARRVLMRWRLRSG